MTSVPVEVVHTMLSNNLEIKKCFVPLFRAGTLPNRVDVRLSMLPSGRVEGVGIVDPQYAGTELDRCLAMAITAVKFPPSSVGQKLVYPFILQ